MKTKQIMFNPAKYEAQKIAHGAVNAVTLAVKAGILVRPDHCPRCEEPENRFRNGRTNIEGHHADYSKPLDVEWMCRKCHRGEQKEYSKTNPVPDPVDSPELIALRDALLTDDWERRPARVHPPRPSLDDYESQGEIHPQIYVDALQGGRLRRWLGEWQDARIKRTRGLSESEWGPMRRASPTDY